MKKKVKIKASLDSDEAIIACMEEIKDDMKTIGTRATWLLGILVLAILGLASFLSKDYGLEIEAVRTIAKILCGFYLVISLAYMPLLIVPKFGKRIYEIIGTKDIQKNIEVNLEILDKHYKHFKSLVSLVTISALTFFVIVLGFWYLNA